MASAGGPRKTRAQQVGERHAAMAQGRRPPQQPAATAAAADAGPLPASQRPPPVAQSQRRRGHRHALSVAPMMKITDRHHRVMMRALTKRSLLYTEMITATAIIHGDRDRLLGFSEVERPLALQLGGDDPTLLAEAARIGEAYGYDEINLNVGCPSPRVQSGNFGAALMLQPLVVEKAVAAMRGAVSIPVTVKHRLGVDDLDSEVSGKPCQAVQFPQLSSLTNRCCECAQEALAHFVECITQTAAPADRLIIHARKAILNGLSPKENREIPPLRYDVVQRLKEARPGLCIEINGGIKTLAEAEVLLNCGLDGVMIGAR